MPGILIWNQSGKCIFETANNKFVSSAERMLIFVAVGEANIWSEHDSLNNHPKLALLTISSEHKRV